MSDLVGVVGTLVGTVLGAGAAFGAQIHKDRRDRRVGMDNLARESCARFMSETADLFEQIRGIVEGAPGVGDRSALIAALRGINGARGQVALENVRISSSMAVVECSQDLWKHLRSKSVPQGSVSPERFREWKGEYWDLRKSLINQVRLDLGVRGRLGQEESD